MLKRRDLSCQGSLLIDVNGKVLKINKNIKKKNQNGLHPSYIVDLACAVLVTPPHGTVEILKDSDTSEVFAKYSCEDKYELLGKATSRCKPDGNWTEPVPTCSRTCVPAVVPLNGSVHMDCAYQNCTALFMCHEGYTLVGDKMSLCQEGMWVHQHIPTCKSKYFSLYLPSKPHFLLSSSSIHALTLKL